MDEAQFLEVDKVLLHVEDARRRADKAIQTMRADGAAPHLLDALAAARDELARTHRRLMQGTYWSVGDTQLSLGGATTPRSE